MRGSVDKEQNVLLHCGHGTGDFSDAEVTRKFGAVSDGLSAL
jgi:hypothetical protein